MVKLSRGKAYRGVSIAETFQPTVRLPEVIATGAELGLEKLLAAFGISHPLR